MRLTISFLIRKARVKNGQVPIYVRIIVNERRVELSTKIMIEPDMWDEKHKKCLGRTRMSESINNHLKKTESDIRNAYNRLLSLGPNLDVNDIKDELLGCNNKDSGLLQVFDYYLKTIENNLGKGYAFRTLKHYRVTRNKIGIYVSSLKRKDIPVYKIDYRFLNGFDLFLKSSYKIHQNTAWNYHKHLRRVLNLAVSLDYIPQNPYGRYKVKLESTHREFVSMSELKKIERKNIDIERLGVIRDAFVFACYTGLSYADIARLSKEHIQIDDKGKDWIIINRSKNNNRCMIPLFSNAKAILQKYINYPEAVLKGRLLPILSNQRMNSYLKELADICGIKKNLTMHVARHTFATSVTLSNGVPIETVSKILGHTSLKTTQIYAKVLANKIADDMDKLQEKLHL